jgi:hypothetical protein
MVSKQGPVRLGIYYFLCITLKYVTLLSFIVLNKEQAVQSCTVMRFGTSRSEYMAAFKRGPWFLWFLFWTVRSVSDLRFSRRRCQRLVFWIVMPFGLIGRYQRFEEHKLPIFSQEDGDSMFLRSVGIYQRVYTASHARTTLSSSLPWKRQISHVEWFDSGLRIRCFVGYLQ